jgi:hypothetical protein
MLLVAVMLIAVACDSVEPSPATTTSLADQTTTTVPEVPTTTVDSVTTTSAPETTTTTTGLEIDVETAGGETEGPDVFEVTLGETVDIWILSDVDDEIHVHGYDLRFDLKAGVPFNLSFEADVPGVFEVETHERAQPLFEIEVTG